MYNKHAYVHTAKYGWSTLPFKIDTPFIETTAKCDIELVLLHCWLFGKVLKIHQTVLPNIPKNTQSVPDTDHPSCTASSKSESNSENLVIPRKANSQIVIPGNVADDHVPGKIMWCTVSIECLGDPMVRNVMEPTIKPSQDVSMTDSKHGYAMRSQPPPKKVTHHTSGRKMPQIDYTQFDTGAEPPSPPKKHRKVDLKRRPSRSRTAAEKYKTKPLGGLRLVRNKLLQSSSLTIANPVMTTDAAQPSTSGTVTVAATADETQTAIEVLLSLGSDIPAPDAEIDENAALVPLVPQVPDPEPPLQPTDEALTVPIVISTAVKEEKKIVQPKIELSTEKKKKTFVTVEYKLKQKYVNTKCKFPCENLLW